jgi:hypothetical protein
MGAVVLVGCVDWGCCRGSDHGDARDGEYQCATEETDGEPRGKVVKSDGEEGRGSDDARLVNSLEPFC